MSGQPSSAIDFHFVAGNPQSESEKRNVRTIVRSNASNRRWRLVRETAAKDKKSDGDGQSEVQSQSDGTDESIAKPVVTEGRRKPRKPRVVGKTISRRQSPLLDELTQGPTQVVNLAHNFYGSMPVSAVSKESIARMLQGTAASYAQLFPSGKGIAVSQMARDWFHRCMQTSGILHTALFCQAMRAQAARPGWSPMPANELVMCQTEAVRAIKQKLTQADTACDDESLRIVFSLTWHGAIKQPPPAKFPKQSPMADLQSLSLFMGIIACDPIHAQGLANMLSMRGGLHNVDMPGLAFLVSYGDILTASCNLSRPVYSYGSYAQFTSAAVPDEDWLHSLYRADHPLISLGSGFPILHAWLPVDKASDLQRICANLADLIRASHDYLTGPPEQRNKALMADQRNLGQHTLMMACLASDDFFPERELYELCWFAIVASSFIAVFPVAPAAARFDRLAHHIQQALGSAIVSQYWARAPQLILWTSVMGALCAVGTHYRDWYVKFLQQETRAQGIHTWEGLKSRLMDLLWFPCVSDTDGEDLWAEIDQLGRISSLSSPDSG